VTGTCRACGFIVEAGTVAEVDTAMAVHDCPADTVCARCRPDLANPDPSWRCFCTKHAIEIVNEANQ
jgi:hypothetical protein